MRYRGKRENDMTLFFVKLDNLIIDIEKILNGLSYVAVLSMFFLIILSVVSRYIVAWNFTAAIPIVEYLLLYIPLLVAPYLVRSKGHIFVELGLSLIPKGVVKRIYEKAIYLISAGICIVAVYVGAGLFYSSVESQHMDIRAIDIPEWVAFFPIVLSFSICAYEFIRFFLIKDSFFVSNDEKETL